jgi:hypothetical protein
MAPFFVTLVLLAVFTMQSYLILPYVAPKYTEGAAYKANDEKRKDKKLGVTGSIKEQVYGFFRPLKVFKTRHLQDWHGKSYYGVTLLAIGTFISVLATAYVVRNVVVPWFDIHLTACIVLQPLMLQLFSTNIYGFRPTQVSSGRTVV